MAETSTSIINDWIKIVAPDAISAFFREVDAASSWLISGTSILSTARHLGLPSALRDARTFDVIATALALNATRGWVGSQSVHQTSAIPDWLAPRDWRDDLAAEISAYELKVEGWDGHSAVPIHPVAILDATSFVRSLAVDIPPPIDQPCSDGEINLVWRVGDKFATLAFAGDHTFSWYATNGREEESGEDLPINSGLPVDLQRLMGFASERLGSITTSFAPRSYQDQLELAA